MPDPQSIGQPQPEHLHAIISGAVQGVSFRYYTTQTARRLGLVGWVRNRPDHTVEVRAEGLHQPLEELLAFIKHGPPEARVTRVNARWQAATHSFTTFDIRHDSVD